MKVLKLLFLTLFASTMFTSCVVTNNEHTTESLEEIVTQYDLWYIDYHRTTGTGDVPFISKAFTVSFLNGRMYANNNIVDIGRTGNGLGIEVGTYNTYNGYLETRHNLDGYYDFDVVIISGNEIRIDFKNVSYYLVGYYANNFNYDKLFYENIEYFLQEYVAWERVNAVNGTANAFDNETFLQFTPKNNTTFYSSRDALGTNIDLISWDFVGSYVVDNVRNREDLKILTLNYESGDTEEFELSVINDETIKLYHLSSQTTYTFSGRGFVQYLKGNAKSKATKPITRNSGRKRTKITRKTVDRKIVK